MKEWWGRRVWRLLRWRLVTRRERSGMLLAIVPIEIPNARHHRQQIQNARLATGLRMQDTLPAHPNGGPDGQVANGKNALPSPARLFVNKTVQQPASLAYLSPVEATSDVRTHHFVGSVGRLRAAGLARSN
ncbi:hypothetical protein BDZ88DRAFT_241156 [Geranomyces variabilis]|nr:hypothetical protein BDZ88DRAFT_241156 [Geranomyces variabilis]